MVVQARSEDKRAGPDSDEHQATHHGVVRQWGQPLVGWVHAEQEEHDARSLPAQADHAENVCTVEHREPGAR